MMTAKFWRSVYKDGYIRTFKRGHRRYCPAGYILGREGLVDMVGQDEHGNKYYQDYSTDHHFNQRWVEYANHKSRHMMMMDQIPGKWVGWLAGTYIDVPSEGKNFVTHDYILPHKRNLIDGPNLILPEGNLTPWNPHDRKAFQKYHRDRKASGWEVLDHDVCFVFCYIGFVIHFEFDCLYYVCIMFVIVCICSG